MNKFYKIIKYSALPLWLGMSTILLFNITIFQWEFYAFMIPTVILIILRD